MSDASSIAGAAGDSQKLRAKLKMMKRKVDVSEGKVKDREEAIAAKQREVDVKEKVIAERDKVSFTFMAFVWLP